MDENSNISRVKELIQAAYAKFPIYSSAPINLFAFQKYLAQIAPDISLSHKEIADLIGWVYEEAAEDAADEAWMRERQKYMVYAIYDNINDKNVCYLYCKVSEYKYYTDLLYSNFWKIMNQYYAVDDVFEMNYPYGAIAASCFLYGMEDISFAAVAYAISEAQCKGIIAAMQTAHYPPIYVPEEKKSSDVIKYMRAAAHWEDEIPELNGWELSCVEKYLNMAKSKAKDRDEMYRLAIQYAYNEGW